MTVTKYAQRDCGYTGTMGRMAVDTRKVETGTVNRETLGKEKQWDRKHRETVCAVNQWDSEHRHRRNYGLRGFVATEGTVGSENNGYWDMTHLMDKNLFCPLSFL